MVKKILLIDLSSIFWQLWHATKDQEVGSAIDGSLHKIHRHASDYDHVGICLDAPPYKRKEIFPEYKAQRDKPSEVAIGQLDRLKGQLEADGFHLFAVDGWEADDVIATITEIATTDTEDTIDILTGDKDLAQLITERVCTISTQTGDVFDPPAVFEKFGVNPNRVGDLLALMGDKSDNVPGVPRVGAKTAAALLYEFGYIDELLKVAASGDPDNRIKPPAVRNNVLAHIDTIPKARDLVALNSALEIDIAPLYEDMVPKPRENTPAVDVIDEVVECEVMPAEPAQAATIVKRQPDYIRQLEPKDSTAALNLSRLLFDSRLYTKFQNPESILAVLLRGRALGLDATTALDAFHVIQGRPTMAADLIVGLVLSSPRCQFFKVVESTDMHAVYKTHRSDDPDPDPTVHEFNIEMAKKMGLTGKDNWRKQPATMLRHRCATALARMVYPDVVGGLYDPEEIETIR